MPRHLLAGRDTGMHLVRTVEERPRPANMVVVPFPGQRRGSVATGRLTLGNFEPGFEVHLLTRLAGPLVAALMASAVALFAWHGADLPAQVYRAALFERYGLLTFDTNWYAGHYVFTYSLLTPMLASALGLRLLGIGSAVAAAAGYQRLAARSDPHEGSRAAVLSSVVFALGIGVPLLVGQITFLSGLALGLWALVAIDRRWPMPVGPLLALACSLTSPLSGAFLVLALAALAVAHAHRRGVTLLTLVVAASPLLASAVAFPESGKYGFPVQQLLAVLACGVMGWLAVPARLRALRIGLLLYAAAGLVLFFVSNPVGGNLVRLGATLAPAVLVAACWPHRKQALTALLIPALLWQWSTGVYALADARGDPTRSLAYFQPLIDEIATHPGLGRIEIPFTNQHWETAYVAPRVPLARGWERQLDEVGNPLFYGPAPLSAAQYRRWLYDNGVTWVALPDAPLDMAGKKEAALLGSPLPYLAPVWHNSHWTLWSVTGSPGLVTGPARLRVTSPNGFALAATRPGTVTVRFHYTRTWMVTQGNACVRPGQTGWTEIVVRTPGQITVSARPLARATDCDGP